MNELEKAAEYYVMNPFEGMTIFNTSKAAFIAGAAWQKERSYSEEEIFNLIHSAVIYVVNNSPVSQHDLKKWFNEHKKK